MKTNFSVKNKIFGIFVVVIVISVGIIGWYGFVSSKDSYINSALELNKNTTKAVANEMMGVLKTIPNDVVYNANFYALKKLLIWEDLKDKRKINKWKNSYISTLKDYILNKKLYYQVRILDTKGNENILLKYNYITNQIIQIPEDKLRNKSHRDYFKKALTLKKGEFYISVMNLNTERGMIEKPYVPVIRYSAPIIDENGDMKGVIVLNFNANNILEIINKVKTDKERVAQKFYLLNEDGYYLYSDDKEKRWGFQLGTGYNFKQDNKGVLEEFKEKDKITFIKNGKIFSMHRVYPNKKGNKYRFWYLVSEIDEKIALSSLSDFVDIFFIILLVVVLFGLVLINWYITKITNPLTKITTQLKALSDGEIQKENIVYNANDEVGEIVKSTTKVIDSMESIIKQANAVANGNFSREFELLGKNDMLGLSIVDMTKRLQEISNLASKLSTGDYNVSIVIKSSEDELGLALTRMVKYLEEITKITESISVGKLNVKYALRGEDDRLGKAILAMIEYLMSVLQQANAIANEDYSSNLQAVSQEDELGQAIVVMTDILRETSIRNKNESYFSDGVARFSDGISGMDDTMKLSKEAISIMCRYINGSSGVVYLYNREEEELSLLASFAYMNRGSSENKLKLGDGVVGQVALEHEPILLKNIKNDDYEVESGTTVSKAKEVYAFPLLHEDELYGVVEIMSFENFTDIQRDYLKKISIIFAATLHTTTQNVQIKELLATSQESFEELQLKSEELEESNIQMEEQQRQLTLQSKDLKNKNDNLARAKEEIDKRASELEKASKYKSEFLANMSHELRTPLNSIILLSKLLTKNQENTLSQKDVQKSQVIHKAGNDLLLLINDILDLSKVESGQMELEYEEIASMEIAEDMRELFEPLAEDKELKFIIEDKFNATFITDKTKLEQVIKNLLSNAFKFTKKGSVTLKILNKNTFIEISVIDTGIGIPENKLDTIFDAFKQVDGSISREFGGTGLGLSISKTIVGLMDGDIKVHSRFGEGTSFVVVLPVKNNISNINNATREVSISEEIESEMENSDSDFEFTSIAVEDSAAAENSTEFNGKNILIVDDDSRNIFTLTSTLEDMNAEVYSAFNGQEAIEFLNDEDPIDMILMDIMMPIMDGLKAIEAIKADARFKHIPIIAITAKTMPEDKQKCLDAGANDYISKPLQHDALVSMIKAWL